MENKVFHLLINNEVTLGKFTDGTKVGGFASAQGAHAST